MGPNFNLTQFSRKIMGWVGCHFFPGGSGPNSTHLLIHNICPIPTPIDGGSTPRCMLPATPCLSISHNSQTFEQLWNAMAVHFWAMDIVVIGWPRRRHGVGTTGPWSTSSLATEVACSSVSLGKKTVALAHNDTKSWNCFVNKYSIVQVGAYGVPDQSIS